VVRVGVLGICRFNEIVSGLGKDAVRRLEYGCDGPCGGFEEPPVVAKSNGIGIKVLPGPVKPGQFAETLVLCADVVASVICREAEFRLVNGPYV